jgi:hypothetical protein
MLCHNKESTCNWQLNLLYVLFTFIFIIFSYLRMASQSESANMLYSDETTMVMSEKNENTKKRKGTLIR